MRSFELVGLVRTWKGQPTTVSPRTVALAQRRRGCAASRIRLLLDEGGGGRAPSAASNHVHPAVPDTGCHDKGTPGAIRSTPVARVRARGAALLGALAWARPAQATLSAQGFGYSPGQFSTRAQATGGAVGEMDPMSPINPATIAVFPSRILYLPGRSGMAIGDHVERHGSHLDRALSRRVRRDAGARQLRHESFLIDAARSHVDDDVQHDAGPRWWRKRRHDDDVPHRRRDERRAARRRLDPDPVAPRRPWRACDRGAQPRRPQAVVPRLGAVCDVHAVAHPRASAAAPARPDSRSCRNSVNLSASGARGGQPPPVVRGHAPLGGAACRITSARRSPTPASPARPSPIRTSRDDWSALGGLGTPGSRWA